MAYGALARHYDALMAHVDYERWASIMLPLAGDARQVLDLACGTGRFTEILCQKGYDVVAADSSEDMLAAAQSKGLPALFLQQDMTLLDLFGTVQAAFCTLDGLNYLIKPNSLQKTLERVFLFLEPGGAFVFDMLTEKALRSRNGKSFSSDSPEAFCVWRGQWEAPICHSHLTLFSHAGNGLWRRAEETHLERAWTEEEILSSLKAAGFSSVKSFLMFPEAAAEDERICYAAYK